jgi:hypothetical protein
VTVLASSSVVAPSRRTIGRFELLLELGRGGMAVLHLACLEGIGGFMRLFAVKQILPHLAADPQFVDMFFNEARIAARLMHPNLCTVFELGQHDGELYLVMEYLDGVPWEVLARAIPHDARGLQLTAGVLAQACEGLHHAHTFRDVDGTAMPIVHRDVSPQNVFVSVDGTSRVLDFGVSKIATDRRRTRTGVVKGKLPYMSPEQLRGEPLDGRADVWAAGVMLWEALTGARLFDRDTDFLIYQAITGAAIPSVNAPGRAGLRYPEAIDGVIARALARDREARYASARELGHALAELAAEVGGAASREQIADAVGALCSEPIAARKQAIASALARRAGRPSWEPDAAGRGVQAPGREPAPRASTAGDAAATLSMTMRKDSIVVERPRRRRWPAGLAVIAVLAGGVAIVRATSSGSAPERPPTVAAPSGDSAEASATDPSPAAGASATSRSAAADPAGRTRTSGSAAAAAADPVAPNGVLRNAPPSIEEPSATPGDAAPAPAPGMRGSPRDPIVPATEIASAPPGPAAPVPTRTRTGAPTAPRAGSSGPRPSPRDRQPREPAAGADAAALAPGWYAIDSAPYATVFVDDRKIGDTPLDRIPLAAGAHRVRAVLADGRQRTFSIAIASDRKTSSGTLTW